MCSYLRTDTESGGGRIPRRYIKAQENPPPERIGRRGPDTRQPPQNRAALSRSHSRLEQDSLQFALIHLVSRVFPGTAFCGDALPLGCQGDPSSSSTSAELAGTGLWNISETQRQRDKQTTHPHLRIPTHPCNLKTHFLNRR